VAEARQAAFAVGARQSGATRSVVRAPHGMVAAAQPLAVQAGVEILRRGGSAVDAALAANACLAVMEPTACGLGGDLFAMVWDPAARQLHGLNASGRALRALSPDDVPPEPDGTIPLHSPYAWTVPGCAAGWFDLHRRFGALPMGVLLAPAIGYARDGFPLSAVIADEWEHGAAVFADKPGFAEVFLPGGRAPHKDLWLWHHGPAEADAGLTDLLWKAYLRRFDQEHFHRFARYTWAWPPPAWPRPRPPAGGRP